MSRKRNSVTYKSINFYIGEQVKLYRESRNITQEELSKIIGYNRASIVNIESGYQGCPTDTLYDIANTLGCNIADLLPSIEWFLKNRNKRLKKVITFEIVDE
jgi:transcriptional regulator with XRE-family HTH domain